MKSFNKWFWGLFFIMGGAAIIINQLGYFERINIYSLVLSIFLIAIICKSIPGPHFFGILFPIAALCIIFSKQLDLGVITPWPVLITALFASVGLTILFHRPKSWFGCHNHKNHENFGTIVNNPDENEVSCVVNFGSSIKYVNSESLEKADLSCSFGALKVYFDGSKVSKKGAVINITASFSGVELYIPKTWNVVNDIRTNLSGVEEKNRRVDSDGPLVTLTGEVNLSGVEITYI